MHLHKPTYINKYIQQILKPKRDRNHNLGAEDASFREKDSIKTAGDYIASTEPPLLPLLQSCRAD